MSKRYIHTVNFHLLNSCNLKCKFCYAHFSNIDCENLMSLENLYKIITMVKNTGCRKINFAGGEPLLHPHIGDLIQYAYELGLKISIVTNGTLLKQKWLDKYGRYINWIAISCDSVSNETQYKLGRGKKHVSLTLRAFEIIRNFNARSIEHKIRTKLNTVVTRLNWQENMEFLVKNSCVERWKILQILLIRGENDNFYKDLSITSKKFDSFVERHKYLESDNLAIVAESNNAIANSYIMINPHGQFFQNPNNEYILSDNILDVGFHEALKQVGFSEEKFISRGGLYDF